MDWLLISIFIVIIILAIVAIWISKKSKRPVDYYNLFMIGIIWFAVSLPLKNPFMFVLGLGFVIYSLINKKKWKANRKDWNHLNNKQRKTVLWITLILGLLVLATFVFWYLSSK